MSSCKSYSHFFSKKFQHICVSLHVNFNESLTNDIFSFEQLGHDLCCPQIESLDTTDCMNGEQRFILYFAHVQYDSVLFVYVQRHTFS